jgi:hypothetical protein
MWTHANIVRPMTDLQNGGFIFNFDEKCIKAMNIIQDKLTSFPIIIIFSDFSNLFIFTTDASAYGISGILSQIDNDNKEHPIAYASRRL